MPDERTLAPSHHTWTRLDQVDTDEGLERAAVETYEAMRQGARLELGPNETARGSLGVPPAEANEVAVSEDDGEEDAIWHQEARTHNLKLAWYKRPSLGMIIGLLFTIAFALGIGLSSVLVLMLRIACTSIDKEHLQQGLLVQEQCSNAEAQVLISTVQLYAQVLGGVTSILVSGKVGQFSDTYGRKRVLLYVVSLISILKIYVNFLLDPNFQSELHFKLFVFAEFLGSLGGGPFLLMSVCCLYVTDLVDPEARTKLLGLVLAALYSGITIGPVFGAFILDDVLGRKDEVIITCYIQNSLLAVATAFTLFVIPESRPLKARQKSRTLSVRARLDRKRSSLSVLEALLPTPQTQRLFLGINWREVLFHSNVVQPLKILWIPANHPVSSTRHHLVRWTQRYEARITLLLLLGIELLLFAAATSMGPVIAMYSIFQFQWTATQLSAYILVTSGTRTVTLTILAPLMIHFLKNKAFKVRPDVLDKVDLTVICVAVFVEVLGSSAISLTSSAKAFLSSNVLMALGALGSPALQSSIVKYGPKQKTGEVFGALAIFRNFVGLVGPFSFLYVYRATVATNPRVIFYIMTSIYASAGVMAVLLVWHVFTGALDNPNAETIDETTVLLRRNSTVGFTA